MRIPLACPPAWSSPDLSGCTGVAKVKGAKAVHYEIGAGATKKLRFSLSRKAQRRLARRGSLTLAARAKNADATGGTVARAAIRVR